MQGDLLALDLERRFAQDCHTWRKVIKDSPSTHASMAKDVNVKHDDGDLNKSKVDIWSFTPRN